MTELLERHRPILRYDSQGSFLADSPAIMTNRVGPNGVPANLLRRANGDVLASAAGGRRRSRLELGFLAGASYRDDAVVGRSDHLDALGDDYVLQAREMHRDDFADRIYGREAPAGDGGAWLQFWFFYLYNNKAFLGFGLHEGDWEMVQVRVGADGRPDSMGFAQHTHGQRCPWGAVERRGERPIVYVARGSQASYPFAGRHDAPVVPDQADGKGAEVLPALEMIADDPPGWVAWPGRWGSSKARNKLESNSPRGPAHHDKWNDPQTFHEECDEIDPRRMSPEPPPPAPARPDISVRREGDRAVIGYRFPRRAEGAAPTHLLLTLDSPDDDLPPATYAEPVTSAAAEIEHPLPLEDLRYEVRVSAADEHGNVGEQARAELPSEEPG
jgi:hypothetical protein